MDYNTCSIKIEILEESVYLFTKALSTKFKLMPSEIKLFFKSHYMINYINVVLYIKLSLHL